MMRYRLYVWIGQQAVRVNRGVYWLTEKTTDALYDICQRFWDKADAIRERQTTPVLVLETPDDRETVRASRETPQDAAETG